MSAIALTLPSKGRTLDGAGLERKESAVPKTAAKHSLIVGLGATGAAIARYLTARDERVRVIDSRADPPGLNELRAALPDVDISLATLDDRWLDDASRVLLSPGLPYDLPLAVEARRRGLAVIGDIELFALAVRAPVLAVTGSNGKSTVTTLASKMLESQRLRAPAGGNLGPPALDLLETEADAYVLEISSFQMETTDSLAPLAATVLNVSADHLDRHGTLELYAELKEKLLQAAEHAVVNADDPLVAAMGARHARVVQFSVQSELAHGYSIVLRNGERWLARDREPLLRCAELKLRGTHNEANALAALALTAELTTDLTAALDVLRTFTGLPHRCQRSGRARRRRVRRRLEGHERRCDARRSQGSGRSARADRGRLGQRPGLRAARRGRARQAARRRAHRRRGGRPRARARAYCQDGARDQHG